MFSLGNVFQNKKLYNFSAYSVNLNQCLPSMSYKKIGTDATTEHAHPLLRVHRKSVCVSEKRNGKISHGFPVYSVIVRFV